MFVVVGQTEAFGPGQIQSVPGAGRTRGGSGVVGAQQFDRHAEDFAGLVVPELQRRGLLRREYTGTTLRENLDLGRPIRRPHALR